MYVYVRMYIYVYICIIYAYICIYVSYICIIMRDNVAFEGFPRIGLFIKKTQI